MVYNPYTDKENSLSNLVKEAALVAPRGLRNIGKAITIGPRTMMSNKRNDEGNIAPQNEASLQHERARQKFEIARRRRDVRERQLKNLETSKKPMNSTAMPISSGKLRKVTLRQSDGGYGSIEVLPSTGRRLLQTLTNDNSGTRAEQRKQFLRRQSAGGRNLAAAAELDAMIQDEKNLRQNDILAEQRLHETNLAKIAATETQAKAQAELDKLRMQEVGKTIRTGTELQAKRTATPHQIVTQRNEIEKNIMDRGLGKEEALEYRRRAEATIPGLYPSLRITPISRENLFAGVR